MINDLAYIERKHRSVAHIDLHIMRLQRPNKCEQLLRVRRPRWSVFEGQLNHTDQDWEKYARKTYRASKLRAGPGFPRRPQATPCSVT